jgi:hypothetical protein
MWRAHQGDGMAFLDSDDLAQLGAGPLEVFEGVMTDCDWSFERSGEDELTAAVKGSWCTYQVRLVWRADDQVLQLVCQLDMRVPENKRPPLYETLGLINERLWLGHFELWATHGELLYRHATPVDIEAGISPGQAELLIQAAISECERFYPVFQFVLWAGKRPSEAIELAMLETAGEA